MQYNMISGIWVRLLYVMIVSGSGSNLANTAVSINFNGEVFIYSPFNRINRTSVTITITVFSTYLVPFIPDVVFVFVPISVSISSSPSRTGSYG
jgi:hypothetical protein